MTTETPNNSDLRGLAAREAGDVSGAARRHVSRVRRAGRKAADAAFAAELDPQDRLAAIAEHAESVAAQIDPKAVAAAIAAALA